MKDLLDERRSFLENKDNWSASSLQLAAVQLVCGLDLHALMRGSPEERRHAIRRLERFVERERLKGLSRHWSYDLNRHIALVQALDTVGKAAEATTKAPETKTAPAGAVINSFLADQAKLSGTWPCARGPSAWRAPSER